MLFNGRAALVLLIITGLFSTSAIANRKPADAVPGEYVVRLKKNINKFNTMQLSQSLRASIKSVIPSLHIVVVKRPVFETTNSAVKSLAENPMVDVVEPNYIYKANQVPNDPMLGQLWGFKNSGQADSGGKVGIAGVDIDVEKAWDIETGSKNMIVAVIDTGIDFNHPDLKDNLWTNLAEANGVAGVDDDGNGVIDDIHGFNSITGTGNAQDDQGHGSHCAGTIGAKGDDGKGIVGINWNVQLMAVKFLDANGSGTLENAIKSIDYATRMGAKVLSNSWGGGDFSQTLFDVIDASSKAGAIFIAAAGNDGSNNDDVAAYPASFEVENVLSVAAINNRGELADFSNYGKKLVHLGAPGVNIYSSTGGAYDSWSGTSMATPHVSGVAALVWAHEPTLTAVELKHRLMQSARPIAGLRNKTQTGGLLNAYNALTNTTPAPDLNDPMNWQSAEMVVQSKNPYGSNMNETRVISQPGAKEMSLYFELFDTEGNYDTVTLIDAAGNTIQVLSGHNDDMYSAVIPGNTVTAIFKSDSSVEKTGWKISKVAFR
ncbi:MAG: S8 family serine peptidase [Bdellovibrio sp.]|nr:S8 family serine peptidase [Bdellovibrio sp.]